MREHMRVAALWARALNCNSRWPFFDVAAAAFRGPGGAQPQLPGYTVLDEDASLSEPGPLETRFQALWEFLHTPPRLLISIESRFCLWFARWEALGDAPLLQEFSLPHPYLPLLTLFERGGWFTREHGYIDIAGCGLLPSRAELHLREVPFTSLDGATLDRLDHPERI